MCFKINGTSKRTHLFRNRSAHALPYCSRLKLKQGGPKRDNHKTSLAVFKDNLISNNFKNRFMMAISFMESQVISFTAPRPLTP
jgi:hypothetical protein